LAQSQIVVKELDDSVAFILLKCFRGDDDAIPHAKQLLLKYLRNLNVMDTIREMDESFRRSEYILSILTKPEYHPRELRALKAVSRDRFREMRRTLAYSLENFAGLELVEQIGKMNLPFNGLSDWGAIACWELRKRAFLALARLLYVLRDELGGADRFAFYIPYLRSYYAVTRKGSESKIEEERMVLQAIVSAAFHPVKFPFSELKEYVEGGMAVAGLHYAADLNPELITARVECENKWLSLHTQSRVEELRKWMDEALRKNVRGHLRLMYATPYVEGLNPKGISRPKLFSHLIPTPFFEVPSEYWKCVLSKNDMLPGSVLSGNIPLKPIPIAKLPTLFPHQKLIPVEGIFAPMGGGKTSLRSALDEIRIRHGYVVFQPTIKREQSILCCLPALPICAQAKRDHDFLKEKLKIQPQAVPSKFLTICQNENQIASNAVWTIYDEIILVDKLSEFSLDWDSVFKDFPSGELIVRRLKHDTNTNIVRANVISSFFADRETSRERKVALGVDELQDILMAQVFSKQDAQIMGAASRVLGDIRGLNLPFSFSAIRPGMIQPEALEACTSIFIGELRESGAEASRSTKGRIMEVVRRNFLSDEDALYLPAVDRIMSNRPLNQLKLFFWAAKGQPLRLIRACLPSHMAEITNIDLRDVFREAEKLLDRKILVDFSDVPKHYVSMKPKVRRGEKPPVSFLGNFKA